MSKTLVVTFLLLALATFSSATLSCDPNAYRSLDGTCNNLNDPENGAAGQFFSRGIEGAEFADGVSEPINATRPNERVISNALCRADPALLDHNNHSMFETMFGQFVNHDLEDNRATHTNPQDFVFDVAIWVQESDDSFCFGPVSRTNATIRNYCETGAPQRFRLKSSDGQVVHNLYQVPNDATSWLDLSQVYGHSEATATVLRTLSGGRLKTADYSGVAPVSSGFAPNTTFSFTNMPPPQTETGLPLDQNAFTPFFLFNLTLDLFLSAGDMRLNENVVLTTMHTLFLREHNRLADKIKGNHPNWSDEKIFQEARQKNIAQYQNVVLYQYLPTLLGERFAEKVGDYEGYDPDITVNTDIAFATAAFRYGHFAIHDFVARDECGVGTLNQKPSNNSVPFIGQLGGPITPVHNLIRPGSLENVIRGIIAQKTAPITTGASSSIRDITANPGGTDIVGLDLARGRLNGIPNYARIRDAYNNGKHRIIYGLPGCPVWYQYEPSLTDPIECFNHITNNNTNTVACAKESLAYKLQQVYKKVNRIDALIGLVAEPPHRGSSFGRTLGNMVAATYKKIRAADRYWFENIYSGNALENIRATSMGDIVRRNFPAAGPIPENPFITPDNYLRRLHNWCEDN